MAPRPRRHLLRQRLPPSGPRLEFFDLAARKLQQIDNLPHTPDITIPGLAISPDRKTLLMAQYDQSGSNIILVERFR